MKKWTYETCKEESKKYKSIGEFRKGSYGAYKSACKNKWMNSFIWLIDERSLRLGRFGKWTEETCREESKKYKTRSDFSKQNESAYRNALKFGWINDYSWLKDERFDLFSDKIDCIYAYEFTEQKAVYVGRTLIKRQKERDWEHIFKNDTVSKFAKENNIPVPEMKILETNLTIKEGAENEGIWIELYREDKWNILNIAKAGSIGGLGKGKSKYTYNICKELAEKCKNRSEFKISYPQAYKNSSKNNWLSDFNFINGKTNGINKKHKWTYKTCYEEAKKYHTIADFEKGNSGACKVARANGWMKDYTWFTILWQEKWNKETCYEEAKKYTTLEDFISKSGSCYATACKNKWIDEYTWLERKRTRRGYWQDYDNCYNEALKYKTITDFMRKSSGAYAASLKHGWLDEFFPKSK